MGHSRTPENRLHRLSLADRSVHRQRARAPLRARRSGAQGGNGDYFDNLGGNGKAGAAERQAIALAFSSFDVWETEFRRIAAGLSGGSGWVVLGFNQHTRQLENYWMPDHAHSPAATAPILVMDMYEHAYQMDFGAAAAKYIDAFFQNIQWDKVATRLAASGATKT
ncbi:Superoxide dismutase [Fe] [Variovorax sp. SRS16]|nr:Superoxide dismutase [Fe] [Variovorax sp. SRS16]